MEKREITIVADNIRSLENVGSLFRTGDAVGVKEILCVGISGYPDMGEGDPRRPYLRMKQHQMLAKTALSGINVPFKHFETRESCLMYIESQKLFMIAVEQDQRAVKYDSDFAIRFPCCAVMGNELDGVGKEFLDAADVIVEIPMLGAGKSLNVAVSAGIALFEIAKK
jgi:23S rRNA (guanosine2251-2'-O)-methyltransferase